MLFRSGTYRSNVTIGAKIEYIYHNIKPVVSDSLDFKGLKFVLDKLTESDWGGQFYIRSNTLNKPFFPSKGLKVDFKTSVFFNRQGYLGLKSKSIEEEIEANTTPETLLMGSFNMFSAVPITHKLSFLYRLSLTISNGNENIENFTYRTFIGGERPVAWSVYSYQATPSKRFDVLNFAAASAGFQWEFKKNIYLTGVVDYLESQYPMKWIDKAMFTESIGAHPRRLGFSGKVSYKIGRAHV